MNLKITNISKTNLNGIGALKNVMFNTPRYWGTKNVAKIYFNNI